MSGAGPLESEITFILFLDMVAYSKRTMEGQIEADESLRRALHSLPTYQQALESGRLITVDAGDGAALCFFGDPTAPARASDELVSSLEGVPPIRIGLHCGPVVRMNDFAGKPNVRGVGINVARRVVDAARPGKVTLTGYYAEILSSYDGWRDRIADRGPHRAKHNLQLRLCELAPPGTSIAGARDRWSGPPPGLASSLALGALILAALLVGASLGASFVTRPTILGVSPLADPRIGATRSAPYPTSSPEPRKAYP